MTRLPLKIAFIGARGVGATYSGIETYYEEVGSRLAQRGHDVTAYCRSYFTPDVPIHRGIRVRRLAALRSKHLETISHTLLSTLDSIGRGFDVIQYHAIGSSPLSALPRLWGCTTVASVRGLDWQRAKWGRGARLFLQACEWTSARFPTATVVVSNTLRDHYCNVHGHVPYTIPNAVIPVTPRKPDRILRWGLRKDDFLLFAGRLSPEKGVHTLLEAYRALPPGKILVLAGGSSYSDDYIRRLRDLAGESVLFLGNVDHETMEELYSNCYVYVLPSVMEGLSISLLEALSFGACILATDIPENLEVVEAAGLTFAPGDVDALRRLLERALRSPDVVNEFRARAAERASAQPDWDDVTERTEALYYHLTERRRARQTMTQQATS